ncbi:BTAD domain-containing putative transcriptional regulator [Streptomyces sp. UNOC14_S4]|uniref:AfsR/SARP family transcriptional regulator n=1 Tax=Streptomyces sp. UNOC14_S4 TaxID=2872340 RepID=UPI001E63AC2D|nr:BTAD domain-containing putative transcriptional regulator [Streptomyces sp. UNOC14_S4]MCC3767142.1 tetratricopeptide repeat protein [Streptomyces sp. UNOC14_S4]
MTIQVGGTGVRCGSPQQQATLAVLALRPGHVVPLHELVGAVWGEDAPDSAASVLRTYVWRLRKLLAAAGCDPHLLDSAGDGYQLAVSPSAVDALQAERGAAAAARARAAGRYDECADVLTKALALWRGEPLAGVPGPFAANERSRLAELRLTLLEERFDLDLLRGRHAQVIPELTALTHEQPLRERLHGFLMRALYATGRQADALAVFGKARTVLAQELGLDPGPELRKLHERILAADPTLLLAVPAAGAGTDTVSGTVSDTAPAGPPAVPVRPAQLPPDVPDFTGRDDAVAELRRALTDPSRTGPAVVAVSGMGGMGKSALALRVAHHVKEDFPDGQLYAELRGTGTGAADPDAVLASFLTALGVPRQEIPASLEDRARLFRTVLDGRRVLLVLDDVRDTGQIRPLLPGSAPCAVVLTSRAHLAGVPANAHVKLAEFSGAEALDLVRRIVGARRVDEEEPAAAALVAACAHLPLAVRIVAARLAARPGWTMRHLVDRLADERRRLAELQVGDLAVAAAFELGHRQLTGPQARVFRSLTDVASAGIGLDAAAAALALPEKEADTLLESLVDAALLESPAPGRYRYHDLVRDYARQLPAPEGETPDSADLAVVSRLLNHLLEVAVEAFQWMIPGDPVHSMLPAGRPGPGRARFTDLAGARAWVVGEFDCAIHTVQLLVGRWGGTEPALLTAAADLLVGLGAYGQEIPYAQIVAAAEALGEAAAQGGNHRAAGRAYFICGNAALQATRLARARHCIQLAVEACRRADDPAILQQTYNDLGVIAQFEQRYDEAADCFDRALAIAVELGHRSGELIIMLNAALARARGGRADEALPACDTALAALREVADRRGTAYALCVRGQALHELGRYEDALADYEECLAVSASSGITGQQAQAHYRRAETLRVLGRTGEARENAERAVAYFRTVLGRDRDRGYALLVYARVLFDARDAEQGRACAREALEVFTRAGLPEASQAQRLVDGIG